jgi:hypothetical protein
MKNIFCFLLLTVVFFNACENRKDDENPVITGVRVNNASLETTVAAGNSITLEASVQDSRALGEYIVEIKGVFDGIPTNKNQAFVPFEVSETFPVLNRADLDFRIFDIPNNTTAGLYIITCSVKDEEGNTSSTETFNLIITNSSMPQFEILNPDLADTWEYASGDTIPLFGGVTDDEGITEVKVALYKNNNAPVFKDTLNFIPSVTSFDLGTLVVPVNFPSTAGGGTYTFQFTAKDIDGNIGILKKQVTLN